MVRDLEEHQLQVGGNELKGDIYEEISQNWQNMEEKLNNQGVQMTYCIAVGQPLL